MSAPTGRILVAGGGPAGSVAARVLAKAGADVTLVEPGRDPGPRLGESLLPAARRILRELDLLYAVEGHLTCPGNVAAWESSKLEATDFVRNLDGLGWQLDRSRFDSCLLEAAASARARVLHGYRVSDVRRDESNVSWAVTIADSGHESTQHYDFLVDATGRRARLARAAGARAIRDHAQIAWNVCYVAAEDDRDCRTLVESGDYGWWYTLLAPGRRRIAGFVAGQGRTVVPMRSAADFAAQLARTSHVRERLRGARLLGEPRAADASGTHLDEAAAPGWLAVGDAALAFDPLSSQGLFNALYTGMQGARAVLANMPEQYVARLAAIRAAYSRQRTALMAVRHRPGDADTRNVGGKPAPEMQRVRE